MQYDFNLAPNTSMNMDVRGRFFKYKSGAGMIRVRTSKGGVVDLLPGQGVWNTDFTSLTVQDKTGLQNAGVILAGDFDFHDDRISGSVEVIDGGKNRVNAGGTFSWGAGPSGTAGQINHIQLWNPAGSGKNAMVTQIMAGTSAFDLVAFQITNTQLTSVNGNVSNKRAGGAVSVSLNCSQLAAAPLQPTSMGFICCNGSTSTPFKPTEPIVLTPGYGLVLRNSTQNIGLYTTVEFYEESA